jgi:hypothetical protein
MNVSACTLWMVELNLAWTFLRKLVGSETGTSTFGAFGGDDGDGDGDGDVVDAIESHIELHQGLVFTPTVVQARGTKLTPGAHRHSEAETCGRDWSNKTSKQSRE